MECPCPCRARLGCSNSSTGQDMHKVPTLVGCGASLIALNLLSMACRLWASIRWPRYSMLSCNQQHLLIFNWTQRVRTSTRFLRCSSLIAPVKRTLSIAITYNMSHGPYSGGSDPWPSGTVQGPKRCQVEASCTGRDHSVCIIISVTLDPAQSGCIGICDNKSKVVNC